MAKKVVARTETSDTSAAPPCGIIMPISATANQTEAHWADVQTLLHRAIRDAGFSPQNVWENTAADRVSERIIANIFEHPLVVADISDLNPNVMLELGLRLASKKPTVVIVNSGGVIPFDIRDFHALIYPVDLNMLGMEEFFRKIGKALKDKHDAFTEEDYQPFLGKVVVDVISPGHREVSLDEAIVDRLEEISARLSTLESGRRTRRGFYSDGDDEDNSVTTASGQRCYFTATGDIKAAVKGFEQHRNIADVKILGSDGSDYYLSVNIDSDLDEDETDRLKVDLKILGRTLSCKSGIKSSVLKRNGW